MKVSTRKVLLGLMVMGMMMFSVQKLSAYSYSAWVGMTGDKTIAMNPFLSGSLNGTSYTDFEAVIEFGITPVMDFFISASGWGMVRYDFSGGNNVGIVGLYADASSLGVQYHMIKDLAKIFTLEANVAVGMPYGDMFGGMSIGAVVAPVLHFNEAKDVSFYVELDPSYTLGTGGGFDFKIVPGFAFFDGALSIGFPIEGLTSGNVAVSYAAWLWIPFGGK